jgi:FtsP/CotA-like multicopper oxidase with cupredoxin domain
MDRYQHVSAAVSRRAFLAGTFAAGAVLASCGRSPSQSKEAPYDLTAAIDRTEAGRPRSGRTVTATLTPQQVTVDLGGVNAHTLAYGDAIPGPLIRANVGDEVAVTVTNRLDHPTSVHWMGSHCATTWTVPIPRRPTSVPESHLPTGSPRPTRARTGHIHIPALTSTTAYICQ